LTALPTYRIAV